MDKKIKFKIKNCQFEFFHLSCNRGERNKAKFKYPLKIE